MAIAAAGVHRPRRPQHTLLHGVVREHFRSLLAHPGRMCARPLPCRVARPSFAVDCFTELSDGRMPSGSVIRWARAGRTA